MISQQHMICSSCKWEPERLVHEHLTIMKSSLLEKPSPTDVSVWAESLWLGEGQSRCPSSLFTEAQIPVTIQKLLIRTQISSSDTALHWRDRKSPCLYDAYRAFKCTVMGAKHLLFSKSHEVSRFFLWAVGQNQNQQTAFCHISWVFLKSL